MSAPLNPVIAPDVVAKVRRSDPVQRKQRVAPKTVTRLSMKENHVLVSFLLAFPIQPGQSYEDIAKIAAKELEIPYINRDHITHRMVEFGIKLIPASAAPRDGLIQRVEKLERILAQVIHSRNVGGPFPKEVDDYLASVLGF